MTSRYRCRPPRRDRTSAHLRSAGAGCRGAGNKGLTTAALSFIGAGIILHVGIGFRWPFAHKATQENP